MEKLKQIACDPMCGFKVQSHDDKELIEIARKHTKEVHDKNMTTEELKEYMKDVN